MKRSLLSGSEIVRWGLVLLGVVAVSSTGCSSPSVAKYPYCLMTEDGQRDCRYASLEQCEVSRAGVGGSCDPSPYYTGGAPAPASSGATRGPISGAPRGGR
jgi:hypothetical protein